MGNPIGIPIGNPKEIIIGIPVGNPMGIASGIPQEFLLEIPMDIRIHPLGNTREILGGKTWGNHVGQWIFYREFPMWKTLGKN